MAKITPSPGQSFGDHVAAWNANDTELYTLYDLLNGPVGDIDFGSFTGSTLLDNENAKTLFQQLETALELRGEAININPDFSIWQEEETFTNPANGVYTADGYYVHSGAGGGTLPTVNIKKNTVDMEVGFEQCYELEITNVGGAGATRVYRISQLEEDYKKYAGKTAILSFRIKASVAITLSSGLLHVYDGVSAGVANVNSITTDWVTYSATRAIDASATLLRSDFFLIPTGTGTISATGSIFIQYMKLELGSVATPLIPKSTEKELEPPQRNYQKTYAQGVFPGAATEIGAVWQEITAVADADHTMTIDVKFPKVMKAAPTIVIYDLAGNAGKVTMAAGDNITGTVSQISDSGFKISATNGAAATSRKIAFHYTAISRV